MEEGRGLPSLRDRMALARRAMEEDISGKREEDDGGGVNGTRSARVYQFFPSL
jgi:hypothetical protein